MIYTWERKIWNLWRKHSLHCWKNIASGFQVFLLGALHDCTCCFNLYSFLLFIIILFFWYLLRFRCSQSDHSGCSRTRALTLSVPGHVEQTQARKCNNCMWFYSFELYPLDFHIFNIEIPVQRTKSWVVTFPLGRAIGFEAFNCFSEGKFFSPTCFRSWIWVGFQLSLDEVVFLSVSTHSSLDAH